MVMVRPIWLCTCFSKDQAPLVDDLLLTKLIYLKTYSGGRILMSFRVKTPQFNCRLLLPFDEKQSIQKYFQCFVSNDEIMTVQ